MSQNTGSATMKGPYKKPRRPCDQKFWDKIVAERGDKTLTERRLEERAAETALRQEERRKIAESKKIAKAKKEEERKENAKKRAAKREAKAVDAGKFYKCSATTAPSSSSASTASKKPCRRSKVSQGKAAGGADYDSDSKQCSRKRKVERVDNLAAIDESDGSEDDYSKRTSPQSSRSPSGINAGNKRMTLTLLSGRYLHPHEALPLHLEIWIYHREKVKLQKT